MIRFLLSIFLFVCAVCVAGSHEEKILYICNWANYLPQEIIKRFESETGIHVVYDAFDSLEALETKLISNSGYDVVFPSAWPMFMRCIESKIFSKLDFAKIPNAKFIDKYFTDAIGTNGYQYGVPFLWGMTGIGFDEDIIDSAVPDAPKESWAMLFSPSVMGRLAKHQVNFLDTPSDVFQSAFLYLGLDPHSTDAKDWNKVMALIMTVRDYICVFDSSQQTQNLINGNACMIQGWSTYVNMARAATPDKKIRFVIPKEGSIIWVDMMAIPRDASHPGNAHKFINFLLKPENIAAVSNAVHAANTVAESKKFIDAGLLADKTVFPPEDVMSGLSPEVMHSMAFQRKVTRAWMQIKKGYRGRTPF